MAQGNALMHRALLAIACAGIASLLFGITEADTDAGTREPASASSVQLGPRPYFLINDMTDSPLKHELQSCAQRKSTFAHSDFSMGQRDASSPFPDHTKESYQAAARMGAGVIECAVTFTRDKQLVCRDAQNDLQTTTNILMTPLAAKCSTPFMPAVIDAHGNLLEPATAECRTSDITLAEFKTLRGRMDAYNPYARTAEEFLGASGYIRTSQPTGAGSGTLMTHKESIELFKRLGAKMAPELKHPVVRMPFDGFTREAYAQKLIDEYKQAGVAPGQVRPQSFNKSDVLYWIAREPAFGKQAVYVTNAHAAGDLPGFAELAGYKAQGINIVAPPLFALLTTDASGNIVPSQYALDARRAGLNIITWTLENSGIPGDDDSFFYQFFGAAIKREGDMMLVLDALAKQVGILGIFSHLPATVAGNRNLLRELHGLELEHAKSAMRHCLPHAPDSQLRCGLARRYALLARKLQHHIGVGGDFFGNGRKRSLLRGAAVFHRGADHAAGVGNEIRHHHDTAIM
jgi:glycerophosphoryl diester phosphodiesterase